MQRNAMARVVSATAPQKQATLVKASRAEGPLLPLRWTAKMTAPPSRPACGGAAASAGRRPPRSCLRTSRTSCGKGQSRTFARACVQKSFARSGKTSRIVRFEGCAALLTPTLTLPLFDASVQCVHPRSLRHGIIIAQPTARLSSLIPRRTLLHIGDPPYLNRRRVASRRLAGPGSFCSFCSF